MSTVVRCGTIFLGKIDIGIIPLMTTKPTEQLYNLERRRLKALSDYGTVRKCILIELLICI